MSPLTTTLLLAFASTAAAKGAKFKGSSSGGSTNFNVDWLVPISTGITIIGILIYFFTYFKLKKTAPMFWCIILIFASQVINFFTGLSTAVESFGEKLPVTWGIADAFATFFMIAGNILVFITVHRAIYDQKTFKLPIKIAVWFWQFAMWFGAGYIWGMVVRYSLAWKDLHGFLVKHGNDKESSLLDKEYKELWDTYMEWNWKMRRSIIGVNGAFLAMCISLLILTLVRRKVLTKKEKTHFPGLVLFGRLVSLTATVALQASFLWKEGAWSSKGFTIAVWVIVTWNWLLTLGGYCSIIKSYNEILNPKTDFSWKSADDEEARDSLTGERGGQTYPQGSNAVAGGDYGYAPMTAPYPTYAPADTQYSRHSYEAPLAPKEGFGKKDKKNKDKAPELVGKATLDRIRDIVPK